MTAHNDPLDRAEYVRAPCPTCGAIGCPNWHGQNKPPAVDPVRSCGDYQCPVTAATGTRSAPCAGSTAPHETTVIPMSDAEDGRWFERGGRRYRSTYGTISPYVCWECGAYVESIYRHNAWHAMLVIDGDR